ncbi:MAG: tRNA (cytidine(34)-2'-O)-methyltransferase [Acidobacteriota bacterium]
MIVALFQPSIPPNTGNIARQCAGMGVPLHLIGPLSIDLSARAVRRAGLDYWPHLQLTVHDSPELFQDWLAGRRFWLISKHGAHRYDRAEYLADDVLIFGNELHGLPPHWLTRWPQQALSIPIRSCVRSYNLANSVAIVMAQAFSTAGCWTGIESPQPSS